MKEFIISQNWYYFLIAAAACYLLGCFNFAVLISGIKKKDIRSEGSGNPGTMNMTRTFGLKIGAVNFFCDLIKGGIPALAGYLLFKDYVFSGTAVCVADFTKYFFGIFTVIGHVFPVFLKFKGGKGIASTMGLFTVAISCEQGRWWYFFIVAAILILTLLYIIVFEWGSMGSLLGVSALTVWQAAEYVVKYSYCLKNSWVIGMLALLLAINLITWIAHRKNILRLLAGEERRTSVRKHKNG